MTSVFHPWRSDPNLAPLLHPEYPDDIKAWFIGRDRIEAMWIRINGFQTDGRAVTQYLGILLNEPQHFESLHEGDPVCFRAIPGAASPKILLDGISLAEGDTLLQRLLAELGSREVRSIQKPLHNFATPKKPWWKLWG